MKVYNEITIRGFYKKEYVWELEVDSNCMGNFERFKTLVKELTEDVVER